jgi:hypothetical protein
MDIGIANRVPLVPGKKGEYPTPAPLTINNVYLRCKLLTSRGIIFTKPQKRQGLNKPKREEANFCRQVGA